LDRKKDYNYNIDDVEDFKEFEEYFGFSEDKTEDGEPKELDFG